MGNSQGQVSVIFNPAFYVFEEPSKYVDPLQAEPTFVFFIEEKKRLRPNRVKPLELSQPKLLGSQSLFLFFKLFFENKHPFNVKPLVIAEPAVANARIYNIYKYI